MKAERKGKMFFSCVKVIGDKAIEAIGKEAYESLRVRNADIPTFSFK
jgi:predicted nucleic acid-binding protein